MTESDGIGLRRIRAVAAINLIDGAPFDWAVYIGTGSDEHIATYGTKQPPNIAAAMFPDLPVPLYRK
jgi:hypothetical protein